MQEGIPLHNHSNWMLLKNICSVFKCVSSQLGKIPSAKGEKFP